MAKHSASSNTGHEHSHTIPFKVYLTVLLVLLTLTIVTVAIAQVDFGNMNLVVAMVIASIKAAIVGLFFMHLKYENPLIWLYVVFPIVLVGVMLSGIFIDNPYRYVPEKPTVFMNDFATDQRK